MRSSEPGFACGGLEMKLGGDDDDDDDMII